MKKTIFFLLFSIALLQAQAIDYTAYHKNILIAQRTYREEKYDSSKNILLNLFENYQPYNQHLTLLRNIYLKQKDSLNASKTVKQMILNGYVWHGGNYTYSDYYPLGHLAKDTITLNLLSMYKIDYDVLRKEYLSKLDYEDNLLVQTVSFGESFTNVMRGKNLSKWNLLEKYGFDTNKEIFISLLKKKRDIFNRKKVEINAGFSVAINHISQCKFTKNEEEFFLYALWTLVIEGVILPGDYALCYDNLYQQKNRNQCYYGNLFGYKKGEYVVLCNAPLEEINKRRESIYLSPLKTKTLNDINFKRQ